jgi:hypothetical protein
VKTKKWNIITIISLLLIVVEAALVFIFVIPAEKYDKIFEYLEAGKDKKAAAIYEELSDRQQSSFREKLGDFGTYQVNQYIDGDKSYDEIINPLYSAYNLDSKKTPDIMDEYIGKAASLELVKIYDSMALDYADNQDYYSDVYNEGSNDFYNIYSGLNYDSSEESESSRSMADQALLDYLNTVYAEYKAGDMDMDTMTAYAKTGISVFFSNTDEYDLAYDINDNLYYIKKYQEEYECATGYYDAEDYFECVDYCDEELRWYFESGEDTTGFKEKFTSLRQDAYEKGKTFYLSQAEDKINSGDVDGGESLLRKIEDRYGDEVDTSEAWEMTHEPWMTPYVEYMSSWEEHVRADVVSGVVIGSYDNPATLDMNVYLPEYIYLYDIDGNGTPELMLGAEDYTYYIYTYNGSNVVFTGAVRIASMTGSEKILAQPISMPEGYEGYELLTFSGTTWSVDEYYITDGETFIVNGEASTYEAVDEMYNRFYDMQQSVYLDYTDIDGYENFIYSYE